MSLRSSTETAQAKRDAAKYLHAARMIDRGESSYSCRAIAISAREAYSEHKPPALVARYIDAMGWQGDGGMYGWFGLPWGDNQKDRVIALCFMAAMVEAGDA